MFLSKDTKGKALQLIANPIFIIGIFLFFLFIRLYNLHSDVSPIKHLAELVDEGLWVHNARNMYLFSSWKVDELNQAFIGAPLFTYLLFLSFKFFGAGFFQARLISALAGWATLIAVFFLVKNRTSTASAVLSVLILGFMNEFLTFNRLAFPESLQILFYVLMFLLWSFKERTKVFPLLSGACLALAFLTKMSAVYFFPAVLVLWLFEWISQELDPIDMLSFAAGFLLIIIPFYVPFYLEHINDFKFFSQTIGKMNIDEKINLLRNLITFPYAYIMSKPTSVLLVFTCIFYFIDLIYRGSKDLKNTIKNLSVPEKVSVSWIIGGALLLAISPDHADRRYIMFLVPLSVLASVSFFKAEEFNASLENALKKITLGMREYVFYLLTLLAVIIIHFMVDASAISAAASLVIFIAAIAAVMLFRSKSDFLLIISSAYLFYALALLTGDFLTKTLLLLLIAALAFRLLLNKTGISSNTPKYFIFFWLLFALFPYIVGLASNSNNLLYINDTADNLIFYFSSIFFMYLLYISIFKKGLRSSFTIVFIVLFTVNIIINGIWLLKPSYSFYNASREIGKASKKGDVIVGSFIHILSLENETLPLQWITNPNYDKYLGLINKTSPLRYKAKFLLITDSLYNENGPVTKKAGPGIYDVKATLKKIPVFVERFSLAPAVFTGIPWANINLIKLTGRSK